MRILTDIGHPAHVHLFRHFTRQMEEKGHTVLFTCREKEFEINLLKKYGFQFRSFGKKYASGLGKLWGLVEFGLREYSAGLKFKPDILLSHGSMYAAHAAFLLRKPHISLEDTGNWEQVKLYKPFTKAILTSEVFPHDYGYKQIRYRGHHELAYLIPKYFTPDAGVLKSLGVEKGEKYAILRFVSWNASHDIGQKGLDDKLKMEVIDFLESNHIKVFISSEKPLPEKYASYRINIGPEQMHDALYFARLFVGEGTTMAMESGILGTPAIYINTLKYRNVADLEKYGLVFSLSEESEVMERLKLMLEVEKTEWIKAAGKLVKDNIDLTAFLVWFIENYPESFQIMKENPDYQLNFK